MTENELPDRETRAKRYLEHDLRGQRDWYSKRASRFKSRVQIVGMAVVSAGALTMFLQVFNGAPWVPMLTAFFGAVVSLAEGWRQIARYDETWPAYRLASERIKREQRVYVNGAGAYRGLTDETDAFLRFVENVEAIIAEEQRIYWQKREEGPASGRKDEPGKQAPGQAGPQ